MTIETTTPSSDGASGSTSEAAATGETSTPSTTPSVLGADPATNANGDTAADGQAAETPQGSADPGQEGEGESPADGQEHGDEAGEPIRYDFKTPEDMPVDEAGLEWLRAQASQLKIPPEQAQGLLDKHVDAMKAAQQRQHEWWEGQKADWAKAVQDDKQLGGANYAQTVELGNKALSFGLDGDQFETKQFLLTVGALHHPGVVAMLRRVGEVVSDDRFVAASGAGGPRSVADRLYSHE